MKLVTLTSSNPGRGLPYIQAGYVLFDTVTQSPEAVLDGTALTALRTAAVSGLATRHLAREEDPARGVRGGRAGSSAPRGDVCRPPGDGACRRLAIRRTGGIARPGRPRTGTGGARREPGSVAEADPICTCTTSGNCCSMGRCSRPGFT